MLGLNPIFKINDSVINLSKVSFITPYFNDSQCYTIILDGKDFDMREDDVPRKPLIEALELYWATAG
jgi:hypothetical protein